MPMKPVSVTQLNDYLNRVVSTDPLLSNVRVQGEASGVKYHSTGHVYFTLVDSQSRLNCFLHQNMVREMEDRITDGTELIVTGGISVYTKGGSYSLYVRDLEIQGAGDLAIAFEKMKQQLNKEGLFDASHKKALPPYPKTVGVITAETGAAIRDILKTIRMRNHVCDVAIFPAPVQGKGAGEKIAHAIDWVNANRKDVDVLIVGRGGGSPEDLWAFNEEAVARSIYASNIPVISAVGHEIDVSISDLVADVRAATPTAAAQIAVPDTEELALYLTSCKEEMHRQLENNALYQGLKAENLVRRMQENLKEKIATKEHRVQQFRTVLSENDPREILSRGYSIVQDGEGKVVSDADQLNPSETYTVLFHKGRGQGSLQKIERK